MKRCSILCGERSDINLKSRYFFFEVVEEIILLRTSEEFRL